MESASKLRLACVIASVLASLSALVCASGGAGAGVATPRTASSFVDSIGVNTHFSFGGSPYVDDYPAVKQKLLDLDVAHARDGAAPPTNPVYAEKFGDLNAASGGRLRFLLHVGPKPPGTTDYFDQITAAEISAIEGAAGASLEWFEGPNEYNGTGDGWQDGLAAYQQDLHHAVRGSDAPGTPLLCPSLKKPYPGARVLNDPVDLSQVPNLGAWCDQANMHSYPNGNHPTGANPDAPYDSILFDRDYPVAEKAAGGAAEPKVVTETGYRTGTPELGYPHAAIPEATLGEYTPRVAFEYFNAGIKRTYFYELVDSQRDADADGDGRADTYNEQAHYGLLRWDAGLSPKPGYTTLENTIDILNDPGPTNHAVRGFDYSLSNVPSTMHRTVLQNRDGEVFLVMWKEQSSYDWVWDQEVTVPATTVTVNVASRFRKAYVFDPRGIRPTGPDSDPSSAANDAARNANAFKAVDNPTANNFTVPVTDAVRIVKLVP